MLYITAAAHGFSSSLLKDAQYQYVSLCALGHSRNLIMSNVEAFKWLSALIGLLSAAFILIATEDLASLFGILTGISCVAAILFLTLSDPDSDDSQELASAPSV